MDESRRGLAGGLALLFALNAALIWLIQRLGTALGIPRL